MASLFFARMSVPGCETGRAHVATLFRSRNTPVEGT
jgi:hypothetical protein